jgi:hypothetical protein
VYTWLYNDEGSRYILLPGRAGGQQPLHQSGRVPVTFNSRPTTDFSELKIVFVASATSKLGFDYLLSFSETEGMKEGREFSALAVVLKTFLVKIDYHVT